MLCCQMAAKTENSVVPYFLDTVFLVDRNRVQEGLKNYNYM